MNNSSYIWKKLRFLAFVLLSFVVQYIGFINAVKEINNKYADRAHSDWGAANIWIISADCMRKTGAWLVVCEEDRLIPIADRALADDPGHALFLEIAAKLLNRPMHVTDIAKLNIWINLVGMTALLVFFYMIGMDAVWLLLLVLSNHTFFSWLGDSGHPSFIGVAALTALLPMALVAIEKKLFRKKIILVFLGLGFLSFSISSLIRGAIGHMGMIVSISVLLWIGMRSGRNKKKIAEVIILGVLVVIAWQAPRWVLMARDTLFDVPSPVHVQRHGISHNLYIGLGAVPNKFGIKWLDSDAYKAVQKARPGTEYASPEYFKVLWKLYFERIKEDPLEVMRIYKEKGRILLKEKFWDGWLPLWVSFIIAVMASIEILRQIRNGKKRMEILLPLLSITMAFICLFFIQGVLAHPSRGYAFPIDLFIVILYGLLMEYVLLAVENKNSK